MALIFEGGGMWHTATRAMVVELLAALAQDAHIYIVEQNQMPTDQPVAALFRYAE